MIDWYGSKTAPKRAWRKLPGKDDLQRFHFAQDEREHYRRAVTEMRRGVKVTHWMWYVFPQLRALAKSETATYFGIANIAEARAYVSDPILRARLAEATMAVLGHKKLMFGHTDTHKLRSCMTLFAQVVEDPTLPNAVLAKFYDGKPDQLTLDVLAGKKITLPPSRTYAQTPLFSKPGTRLRDEPMDRAEVERFLREFNLSGASTARIAEEWLRDRRSAIEVAWDEAYDSIQG